MRATLRAGWAGITWGAARSPRVVPPMKARRFMKRPSFDDVIRPLQQRGRDRQPERRGCLEVDDELELGRLLDGKISGLRALEQPVYEARGLPVEVEIVDPVGHDAADLRALLE